MTSPQPPLAGLRLSLVGPGRVGSSLAHWAVARGAKLHRVAGRTEISASPLADQLNAEPVAVSKMTSADTDVLLVSVDDAALQQVSTLLSQRQQAPVVLHTSGRNTAKVLAELQTNRSSIGSIHPLKAFPRVVSDPRAAAGVVFGYDGDPPAQEAIRRLVHAWSGIPIEIPAQSRNLYHLAATISAGGVVSLVASACELAGSVGLDPVVGDGLLKLAEEALAEASRTASIADAITGPVARGDLQGFAEQVAELRSVDPELALLVEQLAARTRHLLN